MPINLQPLRLIAPVALALAAMGTASAEDAFCSDGDSCSEVTVYNHSMALVTSVKIEQHTTDGACEYSDNTYTANLSGTGGDDWGGDAFDVSLNKNCKYKFKFNTTSGCKGDKTTHMTTGNFADGKSVVQLKGACGSLKVIKY
jgi:hypothetical protein